MTSHPAPRLGRILRLTFIFAVPSMMPAGCGLTAVTSLVRGGPDESYNPTGETLWMIGKGYELSQMAADEVVRHKAADKGKLKVFNGKVVSKLVRHDDEGRHYVIVVEIKGNLYYCRTDEETYRGTPVGAVRKVVIVT
ncbi:MAG: hypothetical protein HZA50_06340 [Planctomycetes bacterium]|nr:hypothetical protein [Planctomycetota bacterium]